MLKYGPFINQYSGLTLLFQPDYPLSSAGQKEISAAVADCRGLNPLSADYMRQCFTEGALLESIIYVIFLIAMMATVAYYVTFLMASSKADVLFKKVMVVDLAFMRQPLLQRLQ